MRNNTNDEIVECVTYAIAELHHLRATLPEIYDVYNFSIASHKLKTVLDKLKLPEQNRSLQL